MHRQNQQSPELLKTAHECGFALETPRNADKRQTKLWFVQPMRSARSPLRPNYMETAKESETPRIPASVSGIRGVSSTMNWCDWTPGVGSPDLDHSTWITQPGSLD